MADRRARRHEATRREILDAAWQLARSHGLTGWSLRELADSVGMRPPSLYVYFDGKNAIYDAMFAEGHRQMLSRIDGLELSSDPAKALLEVSHGLLDFLVADPARHQLVFLRAVPGFTPSEESDALAREALDRLRAVLSRIGIDRERAVDLWTALLIGLAAQQVSNDPRGDRWARLIDDAVAMFLASRGSLRSEPRAVGRPGAQPPVSW